MIDGLRNRLIEAMDKKEFIQITFKYPDFEKRIFKKGFVKNVYDTSFDFDERFQGHVTFSYDFIIEVREVKNG